MDNWILRVNGEGLTRLNHAMELAFDQAPGGKATHYVEHPLYGLILFWNTPPKHIRIEGEGHELLDVYPQGKFLFGLGPSEAVDQVWGWLHREECEPKEPYPDIDGTVKKGWEVYCEDWGHVGEMWEAFVAIKPTWAMYGK